MPKGRSKERSEAEEKYSTLKDANFASFFVIDMKSFSSFTGIFVADFNKGGIINER